MEVEDSVSTRNVVVKFEDKQRPSPIVIPLQYEAGPDMEPGTSNSDDMNNARTPREDDDGKHDKKKIGHRRVDKVTGNVTYKKVPSHYIMGSIQLGISNSIGSLASAPDRDVLLQDFSVINTTNFPQEGSSAAPSHTYGDFRFKCYAPIAFRYFRELFKIKPEDFLHSVCVQELRELSNPGASGSIFYLSCDDRYIIKTVQHKEADFLQKLLPGYYMNLQQNAHTLLPKFFGLFCYQSLGKNIRLLVMNNLLPSSIKLHQKYDLKGSTYKRRASRHERTKGNPTLKDLDFLEECPEGILLESSTYDALVKTISRDCLVLQSFKIMDYSLLVGVHNLDAAIREKQPADTNTPIPSAETYAPNTLAPNNGSRRTNRHKSMFSTFESIQANAVPVDLGEEYPEGGIPARNAKGERLLVFVGIIDILQNYRLFKKMEHGFKSILHDGDSISVHNPNFYSTRFQEFMYEKVFKKIPSLDLPEVKGPHKKFRTLVHSYMALKHSPSTRKGRSRERKGTSSSTDDPRRSYVDGHQDQPSSGHPVKIFKNVFQSNDFNRDWHDVIKSVKALTARPDLVPEIKPEPSALTPFGRQSSRRTEYTGRQLSRQEATGVTEGPIDKERKVERLFAISANPVATGKRQMNRSVSSDAGETLETGDSSLSKFNQHFCYLMDGERRVNPAVVLVCQQLVNLYPHISMDDALQLMAQHNGDQTECVRALDRMSTSVGNPLFRTPNTPPPRNVNFGRGAGAPQVARGRGNMGRGSFVVRRGQARSNPTSPDSTKGAQHSGAETGDSIKVGRSKFYHGKGQQSGQATSPGAPQSHLETPGLPVRGFSNPGISPLARTPNTVHVQLPGSRSAFQLSSHGSFPSLHITQASPNVDVPTTEPGLASPLASDNGRRSSLPPSHMLVRPQISVNLPTSGGRRVVLSPNSLIPSNPTTPSSPTPSHFMPSFRISVGGGHGGPTVVLGQRQQQKYEPEFIQSFLNHQRKSLESVEEELSLVSNRLNELQNDVNEMEQTVLLRRKHSLSMSNVANAESVRHLHQETRRMQAEINTMNKELLAQKEESKKNVELKRKTGANFFDQMASTGQKGSLGTLIHQSNSTLSALPLGGQVDTSDVIGGAGWNCVACTYLNHAALPYCEVCTIPRVQGSLPCDGPCYCCVQNAVQH